MCGIAGIIKRHGEAGASALTAMAGELTHRGPDDVGTHVAGAFGLAQTRLSIIDLEGGHQPLFDGSKQHALVCNGEIYNYKELRQELETLGARPASQSDSEVALHGWAHWGADSVKRLNGMFAFALFEAEKKQIWLVRDRLGIKPLYYAVMPDQVLFASEIKALLKVMPQTPALHPPALAQYLQNQNSTGRDTIFQGIYRVLPGEMIRIDATLNIEFHRYWRAQDIETQSLTHEEALERWEPLFEQVMTEHMRSDVPFGVFLSGGVDSAVLLTQLKRLHNRPISSFSIGWKDAQQADELDDAARIAKLIGSEHHPIKLSSSDVFKRVPRAVWAADDLLRDYATLPTIALAEAVGKDLKVVFSGEGGDEVFAGYGRYRPAWIERQYKAMRYPGSGGFRARGELSASWAKKLFNEPLQYALRDHNEPFVSAWGESPEDWSLLQRRQFVDLQTNLPDDLLVKADRMLMSSSVEGRVPFLDHRVVEFGFSLPDSLKVRKGAGKVFLRRWAENFLPADHLWRPKKGFHVPVGEWLNGPFLTQLGEKLKHSRAIREWCNLPAVESLLARQASKSDVTREIWSLMQFAIWHRMFAEGAILRPHVEENPIEWL